MTCGTSSLPQWTVNGHNSIYGLTFDGFGEYLSATTSGVISSGPLVGITYVAWIKSPSSGHYGKNAVVDYSSINWDQAAFLVDTGGYFLHEFKAPGDTYFNHNLNTIFNNMWHFVAMSYTGNSNSVVNAFDSDVFSGIALGPQLQMGSSSGGVWIAGDRGGGCTVYNSMGTISDVRIYNRALSPAEIQALYNATK
jgi:hypothetical protein